MVKYRESSQNTLELNTVANVWSQDKHSGGNPVMCQGAFTPDANDANDLHVNSMQRRERQSCGAIRANEAARMARIERFFRANGAS